MLIPVSEKFWLTLLIAFTGSLLIWAIFGVEKIEHKIAIITLVGVIITTITSVITVSITHKRTKERELELIITKEKQKAFEHFYNFYFELLKDIKLKKPTNNPPQKNINELMEFKKGLMGWGSEEIIKSYIEFEEQLAIETTTASEKLQIGGKFFAALRREMGFTDSTNLNVMNIILTSEARSELKNIS